MATLIKNRRVTADSWLLLDAQENRARRRLPEQGDLLVPLATWLERRSELTQRFGRLGVLLASHEGPEPIAADMSLLSLIAVEFPKFSDGRGFSTARLLRERYHYRGELRAVGDVVRDQLLFLQRCGFDAYALREDQDAGEALAAFGELSEAYQSSALEPLPLFRRRYA